jgi:hypothetical protein
MISELESFVGAVGCLGILFTGLMGFAYSAGKEIDRMEKNAFNILKTSAETITYKVRPVDTTSNIRDEMKAFSIYWNIAARSEFNGKMMTEFIANYISNLNNNKELKAGDNIIALK